MRNAGLDEAQAGIKIARRNINIGRSGFYPWVGKIPWRRERLYPLWYSGLENSMDCIVHGAVKSQT